MCSAYQESHGMEMADRGPQEVTEDMLIARGYLNKIIEKFSMTSYTEIIYRLALGNGKILRIVYDDGRE